MVRTKALPAPARVAAVRWENLRTVTVTLAASTLAQPGQFAMLWLPGRDEKPFSFLDCDPLRFTVAAVGPFSKAICDLEVGDTLWWRGPFGRGFQLRGDGPLFVGGGYGVAPLVFLARRARAGGAIRAARGAGVESAGMASRDEGCAGLGWERRASYNCDRSVTHGGRRAAERCEVAATVEDLGLPGDMSRAIAAWQHRVGNLGLTPGPDLAARADAVLAGLDEKES